MNTSDPNRDQPPETGGAVDPFADTQPSFFGDDLARYQPIRILAPGRQGADQSVLQTGDGARRRRRPLTCITILLAVFALILAGYFLFPGRTNLLILGIDDRVEGGSLGRTDTMILATIDALRPYVGLLSIPRDLWVTLPGRGENRINTAHFFAEAEQPGSGPAAAIEAVEVNFDVRADYYVRFRFDSFRDIVDSMGGVEVNLPEAMSGYDAGVQRMNGEQALAFVRDRAEGDDFARMGRGQLFVQALVRQFLQPVSWLRLPVVARAVNQAIETDLPLWQLPRIGLAVLRVGPGEIDGRTIQREMVRPFTTSGGAQVLAPDWEMIRPMVDEMFR